MSCSKCGRGLTSPEGIIGIAADIESILCDACYQNVFFPDAKDNNCESMDYTALTR